VVVVDEGQAQRKTASLDPRCLGHVLEVPFFSLCSKEHSTVHGQRDICESVVVVVAGRASDACIVGSNRFSWSHPRTFHPGCGREPPSAFWSIVGKEYANPPSCRNQGSKRLDQEMTRVPYCRRRWSDTIPRALRNVHKLTGICAGTFSPPPSANLRARILSLFAIDRRWASPACSA